MSVTGRQQYDWLADVWDHDQLQPSWIAKCLSGINRYGNRTWMPWSVARHSVLVERLLPEGTSARVRLQALAHDIHEIWIGDIQKPVCMMLGSQIDELKRLMDQKILATLRVPEFPGDRDAVAQADELAAKYEIRLFTALFSGVSPTCQSLDSDPVCHLVRDRTPDQVLWLERWLDLADTYRL